MNFSTCPSDLMVARTPSLFAQKNNKTLSETLDHKRYAGFAKRFLSTYASCLTTPLGNFLCDLKRAGDDNYRLFLNRYGDLTYSTFAIGDEKHMKAKGVYAYYIGDELKYIGRCRDSMKKRVNQGYGKIHPKNCYIDGQSTNCRLNALITHVREDISLWLCSIAPDEQIEIIEVMLRQRYNPPWNIQQP